MQRTFYVLIVFFTLIGCKNKNKEYTLEGRLMSSCDLPASNKQMSLYQESITLTSNGGYLKDFTCDENGYFKVVYKAENSGKLSIRTNGEILRGIPSKKNLNIGKVYNNPPSVKFIVRLRVNNAYTANDTLYYYDWNYPQNGASHWVKKIAGPFQSGIIDTVQNAGYLSFPIEYEGNPFMRVNYYVNSYQSNEDAIVFTPLCSGTFSEAVLVID